MDIWSFFSILTKFSLYSSLLFTTGIALYSVLFESEDAKKHFSTKPVILAFAFLGIVSTVLLYSIQAASLNGEISGMYNPDMLSILWQTPAGTALWMRLLGLFLIVFSIYLTQSVNFLTIFSSSIALASLTQIGHTNSANFGILQSILLIHLLAASLWIGILLPLLKLCSQQRDAETIAQIAHRFSRFASIFVTVLLIAGCILSYQLLGSINKLFTSSYGITLLLKVTFVSILLSLAVINKTRLVPALKRSDSTARFQLKRSILAEMVVVLCVLLITAILTSIFSVPSAM